MVGKTEDHRYTAVVYMFLISPLKRSTVTLLVATVDHPIWGIIAKHFHTSADLSTSKPDLLTNISFSIGLTHFTSVRLQFERHFLLFIV